MTSLYTADAGASAVFEYAYPSGGTPVATISSLGSGSPFGVAVIPTQYPGSNR